MDVDVMLDSISHAKLMEWAAYYRIEEEEEKKSHEKAKQGNSTSLA